MTEEQIDRIIESLKSISKETNVEVEEIIELLTGFCWDEEDAYCIKRQTLRENECD